MEPADTALPLKASVNAVHELAAAMVGPSSGGRGSEAASVYCRTRRIIMGSILESLIQMRFPGV